MNDEIIEFLKLMSVQMQKTDKINQRLYIIAITLIICMTILGISITFIKDYFYFTTDYEYVQNNTQQK